MAEEEKKPVGITNSFGPQNPTHSSLHFSYYLSIAVEISAGTRFHFSLLFSPTPARRETKAMSVRH